MDMVIQYFFGRSTLVFIAIVFMSVVYGQEVPIFNTDRKVNITISQRYISIDSVCAWPNLTVLPNGAYIATIYNMPSHGRHEGDIECWVSNNAGKSWNKVGVPAPHEPMTNRMLVAAGLAQNKDLIVIAGGYRLKQDETSKGLFLPDKLLKPWISRSSDGGKSWSIDKLAFPSAGHGMTEYIPYGDILVAQDGTLRMSAYQGSTQIHQNRASMFKSEDDGRSWQWVSYIGADTIGNGHNETAIFQIDDGNWIAAARRWTSTGSTGAPIDLFISRDDGRTWEFRLQLTDEDQHPAHIVRLQNGELLLTYGNRQKGSFGVATKRSKDNGDTWSDTQIVLSDLSGWDSGYPASTELEDGSIMTVFYAKSVSTHQRYHMGTVVWNLQ